MNSHREDKIKSSLFLYLEQNENPKPTRAGHEKTPASKIEAGVKLYAY